MKDTRRARVNLGLLLAAALVLVTIDHRSVTESPFGPLRTAGTTLFGAAESAGAGFVRPVGEFFETMAGAPSARGRLEKLRAENQRLRHDLAAQSLDRGRSRELHRLLGVAGIGGYRILPTQVIARRGAPGFEEAVELDVGRTDGVRPEMTVLNADGLVGRVVQVGPSTSTVVLLSDPASAAGARLEGSNEIGVVHGVGENGRLVRFRLLDSTAPIIPGHRIVSFGSQGGAPYVAGVPIGVVERVEATPGELTRIAYARPSADLTALDVVGVVVQAPRRDPRDAVLPPGPRKAKVSTPGRSTPRSPGSESGSESDSVPESGPESDSGSREAEAPRGRREGV
ncbi:MULTISPECIES: rod shape-determining protein MreC [unclassified Streptosporangium]|uniref:rod shape-determining protein MreC n=1 Tax=unclassified Streptosporangium TaxID=2632669 RepID=UPI002E2B8296|nr:MULTISPECIES: rod shape-determining protein MreC [unclassified Streptosporangium]